MKRVVLSFVSLAFLGVGALQAQTLNIWPGVAPGSEGWTQQETTATFSPLGKVIVNVVTPTITAYLPDSAVATGAGVIVAPGGGFVALAIDVEGNDVARWLRRRGVAAYVLKYRLVKSMGNGIPDMDFDTAGRYGIADGIQALKVVRQHAREWGVDPHRVGIVGFSAGAMVSSATLLNPDSAARPDFAGVIYGGPFGVMPSIPKHLPPAFLAWAEDDPFTLDFNRRFYDALKTAGYRPDTRIYSAGGHGFGMRKQGTTSDHWIDDFYWWLQAKGFARRH